MTAASPYQLALALHWALGHRTYCWADCEARVCIEARRVLVVPRMTETKPDGRLLQS